LLKRYRESRGLTQDQLADLAGLAVRTVRFLESRHPHRPRPHTQHALVAALGLTRDERLQFAASWDAAFEIRKDPGADITHREVTSGDTLFDGSLPLWNSDRIVIDERRARLIRTTEEVRVSSRDDLSTHVAMVTEFVPGIPVEVSALENCRVRRNWRQDDMQYVEFELKNPVGRGELFLVRYEMTSGLRDVSRPGLVATGFFAPPLVCSLEIDLLRPNPRRRAKYVYQPAPGEEFLELRSVVASERRLNLILRNPVVGAHGIEWLENPT